MAWKIFPKLFQRKMRDWHVETSTFDTKRFIEITDHKLRNHEMIYENVLDNLLDNYRAIALSQYVDEEQGMLDHRSTVLSALTSQFGLDVVLTKSYDTEIGLGDQTRETEYIVNIFGEPDIRWLRTILRYDGTSLSNILYDATNFDQNWFPEVVKRNKLFLQWYWIGVVKVDFGKLWEQTGFICYTSDSHLSFLADQEEAGKVISNIKDIAARFSYNLIFDRID